MERCPRLRSERPSSGSPSVTGEEGTTVSIEDIEPDHEEEGTTAPGKEAEEYNGGTKLPDNNAGKTPIVDPQKNTPR